MRTLAGVLRAVETFRGFGPGEQFVAMLSVSLAEYDIADLRGALSRLGLIPPPRKVTFG